MKWLAILNPRSGRNNEAELNRLVGRLRQRFNAHCVLTRHSNHPFDLVRNHSEYDGYIGGGGDGTISEIVNALPDDSRVLGILPIGTGNGLAHDLGLHTVDFALHALARSDVRPVDVIHVRFRQAGVWRERRMISSSGVGYVAGATEVAYRSKPKLHGWSHYVGAVWQPFRQHEFRVRLRLDERHWQDELVTSVAVQNTQHLGFFRLFPEARVDDGLMNVLYGRLSPLGQLFEDLGTLLNRRLFEQSTHQSARAIDIETPAGVLFMVDGDLYPNVEAIHYRIQPARLACCAAGPTVTTSLEPRQTTVIPQAANSAPVHLSSTVPPGTGPAIRPQTEWPVAP